MMLCTTAPMVCWLVWWPLPRFPMPTTCGLHHYLANSSLCTVSHTCDIWWPIHHFPTPTTYGDLYTGTPQTVHPTLFPCAYDIWWPVHHYLTNGALYTIPLCLWHLVTCTLVPCKWCTLHCFPAHTTYGNLCTITSQTVLSTPFPCAYDIWWPVHQYPANGAPYTVSLCLWHMVTCAPLPHKWCSPHHFPVPMTFGDLYTGTSQMVHPTPFPCAYDIWWPVHQYLANGAFYIISPCLWYLVAHTPLPRKWCSHTISLHLWHLVTYTSQTVLSTPFPHVVYITPSVATLLRWCGSHQVVIHGVCSTKHVDMVYITPSVATLLRWCVGHQVIILGVCSTKHDIACRTPPVAGSWCPLHQTNVDRMVWAPSLVMWSCDIGTASSTCLLQPVVPTWNAWCVAPCPQFMVGRQENWAKMHNA